MFSTVSRIIEVRGNVITASPRNLKFLEIFPEMTVNSNLHEKVKTFIHFFYYRDVFFHVVLSSNFIFLISLQNKFIFTSRKILSDANLYGILFLIILPFNNYT